MTDEEYLKFAYESAKCSPDPSTQNGAIIVRNNRVISAGYNTFPRRVHNTPFRLKRPAKYHYVEHAERNAIFTAARLGESTNGATMYVPWFACSDCARAIISAGIHRVVGSLILASESGESWSESISHGLTMLREAKVLMTLIPEELPLGIRFQGQDI